MNGKQQQLPKTAIELMNKKKKKKTCVNFVRSWIFYILLFMFWVWILAPGHCESKTVDIHHHSLFFFILSIKQMNEAQSERNFILKISEPSRRTWFSFSIFIIVLFLYFSCNNFPVAYSIVYVLLVFFFSSFFQHFPHPKRFVLSIKLHGDFQFLRFNFFF